MYIGARTLLLAAIAVVIVGVLLLASRHSRFNPSAKPLAPDFSLSDLDDRHLALADYRGKVVLLNFWATWCEPCRKEIPRFMEFQTQYSPRGLQVVGISLDDDIAPVQKFRQQFKVNYPLGLGNAKLAESYGGVLGLPITFLIDRQGHIMARHIGAVDLGLLEKEIQKSLQP